MNNKGTDKQYVAVFLLHISSFVPNFRILTSVVAEKSLTEKKVYNQAIKEKAKTIYPLYTSYRGYKHTF